MKKLIFLLWLAGLILAAKAQQPLYYWTFDGNNYLNDKINNKILNLKNYNVRVELIEGVVGKAINPIAPNQLIVTNLLKETKNLSDFTIELAFKGKGLMFTTFPSADFRIHFSAGAININYTVSRKGKQFKERWSIPLKGTGITSYSNLENDQWHHFVFTARKSGCFELWIDGKTDPIFRHTTNPFDKWIINNADGLRMDASMDELAFYTNALSAELIQQHVQELDNGQHYSFSINPSVIAQRKKLPQREIYVLDEKEFAPGYPNYTVQATDQLKSFPLPRYSSEVAMPRNFPWMAIGYLHRELPQDGGKGFGEINPQTAVRLTDELSVNWNYYVELPTLRTDSVTAQKSYTNPSEIYAALIAYANAHPQLPVATVLMQVQNKPVQAGFDRSSPYVTAKDLADKYYLKGRNKKPIVYNKKNWLSPFTAMELVRKDGLTSAFYINQLAKHLSRKIDMINENGEWFGHKWTQQLLEQSPVVTDFLRKNGMDYERFNGWMQNRFDSVYKATILQNIPWKNVAFTFYNVSAYNSSYWPQYSERISTNSLFNGTPRSTPAFYPARPDNWRISSGPLNGYGTVAAGRKKEMALGVKFFAPFINAGWNLEEKNIRPAQWLGLLKSMVMLGADFFHVGYFNVTGTTGWPDGKGPNDPRGYIYQAAVPAYAQAIASQVWEFLDRGILLEDSLSTEKRMPFAFAASSYNHLVLVRKLDKKYLIYGTVQPSSNYKGNTALEEGTSIILEGKRISFNIRRQGSMYIYDPSGTQPVFYQVDGWHQYEHPWYWSKDIVMEAENTGTHSGITLITEKPAGPESLDFSDCTTYAQLEPGKVMNIAIPQKRNQPLSATFIVKKHSDNPVLLIKTGDGIIKKESDSATVRLSEKELKTLQLHAGEIMELSVEKGVLWLDKMIF